MGIIKKLLRLKFYVALFGAGYLLHSCVNNDDRYRIRRYDSKPHLVDTYHQQSLEIHVDSFQVGSAAYRLRGLQREYNLQEILTEAKREMEAKK